MKNTINHVDNHRRNAWIGLKDFQTLRLNEPKLNSFHVRHHVFTRSNADDDWRAIRMIDEVYDSPLDFLACLRWRIIPQRLREASGMPDETDLESLLDSVGYTKSFIAEELFSMIDTCLRSHDCTSQNLARILNAYNGLSGFEDSEMFRIVDYGMAGNTNTFYHFAGVPETPSTRICAG